MEIKIVDEKGEVKDVEQKPIPDKAVDTATLGEIDNNAIAQVLNLDEKERSLYKDEIGILLDWAKDSGYKDVMELKWKVRELTSKIGSPGFGERMVTRIARYAYLELESKKIQEEKHSLMT